MRRLLLLFVFVLVSSSGQFSRTTRVQTEKSTTPTFGAGETRYFVRLFNCDDSCRADFGDVNRNANYFGSITSVEFGKDSGWIDFTDTLQPGSNNVRLLVFNTKGAIAYGFRILKDDTLVFEQICGRAGTIGCENNRTFPDFSIARTFSYDILISQTEIPLAYQRWLTFWEAFRAAIVSRNRIALRNMISSPYGDGLTPDQVIKGLDRGRGWRELQNSLASGTSPTGLDSKGRPGRATKTGWGYFFEYGNDGRWRWSGENVGD